MQDAVHPVVIHHPDSGRRTLYVNPEYTVAIEGVPAQESSELLWALYAHTAQPQHTCRFTRTRRAVAVWDNRATWHRSMNDYDGELRLMHRVTLEGVPLESAA
ncbi:MAG: TauD/TfdA family dioxygenase [Gammaproteobacteria bacterium]|nr:TauD/TfdA family dioxygenase [Gammaproteobacteria bacterium]